MDYKKYIWSVFLMLLVAYCYEKFQNYNIDSEEERNYLLVKKYLITESSLAKSKLPILWIYVNYEVNSRNWPSFYSRNTEELNQPYIYLTIKSLIRKCGNSFNICLINDTSLPNIIPDWNIDMSSVPNPIKDKLRSLAKGKILKYYGGLIIPPSFLCLKNLKEIFYLKANRNMICLGELPNDGISSMVSETIVSDNLIGSVKNNPIINEYVNYLEQMISKDYTAESKFEGSIDRWLNKQVKIGNANTIQSKLLGVRDEDGKLVRIEDLIGTSFVNFDCNALGIYIPQNELLKRTDYLWFNRLNVKQIMESDTTLGKLFITNYNN